MNLSFEAAQQFLFHEADLLDTWKLIEWSNLFTDDGSYLVPPTGMPDAKPGTDLYLVFDDRHRLGERAVRLLKKTAHAEHPRSRTRHLISNVRVWPGEAQDSTRVTCNFLVSRSRGERQDLFPGYSEYTLVAGHQGQLFIRRKKAVLELDELRPHGRLSIII